MLGETGLAGLNRKGGVLTNCPAASPGKHSLPSTAGPYYGGTDFRSSDLC